MIEDETEVFKDQPEVADDEPEVELINSNGCKFEKIFNERRTWKLIDKAKEAETNLTDQHKIIEQKEKEHYNH